MSLALFRERIEAGDVDETVRAHLRGCEECRAYYDQLQLTARALGDDGAAAERERLMKALPQQAAPSSGFSWAIVAAAMVLVAIGAIFLLRKPADEVTMRGGADPAAPAPFSLRVYGKDAPGQRVRLIADFPGSNEAQVGMRAELQYFVKPGYTLVIVESRGTGGKVVTYKSEPGNDDLAAVGKAFPVGEFGPGSIEVCAAQATQEHQSIADAVKAGAVKYCSTLLVTP